MADEKTIHSGGGSKRGLYIALAVIAVFVLGMAMLGSASAPVESETSGGTETEAVPEASN